MCRRYEYRYRYRFNISSKYRRSVSIKSIFKYRVSISINSKIEYCAHLWVGGVGTGVGELGSGKEKLSQGSWGR